MTYKNTKNYFKQARADGNNQLVIKGGCEMHEDSSLFVYGKSSLGESDYSSRWRSFITDAYSLNNVSSIQFINTKDDFPSSSNGIITLSDNVTYFILSTIDLLGDRLVCGQNTTLIGGSSENCRLKSTGLTGTALISSTWSLPMRNLTIEADIALDLDASENANQALDWFAVNFTNCGSCGAISNYNNFVMLSSAFLDSGDLTFDGSFGTIAFETCLFEGKATQTSIILPSSLTVTRRFRIIYSSFVILSGETGINASTSMSIPNEGYILDTVNFSGGGTYLTGVLSTDNKARFAECRGIANSANLAQYYMTGNSTVTTINTSNTYEKVAGSTSSGSFVEKFDVTTTSNRAIYEGSLNGFYKVSANLVISGSSNKEIAVRVAKNGTTSAQSESISTTNSGGRAEDILTHDIVSLSADDYIEIYITNTSDTSNLTVEDMNIIIERLN